MSGKNSERGGFKRIVYAIGNVGYLEYQGTTEFRQVVHFRIVFHPQRIWPRVWNSLCTSLELDAREIAKKRFDNAMWFDFGPGSQFELRGLVSVRLNNPLADADSYTRAVARLITREDLPRYEPGWGSDGSQERESQKQEDHERLIRCYWGEDEGDEEE